MGGGWRAELEKRKTATPRSPCASDHDSRKSLRLRLQLPEALSPPERASERVRCTRAGVGTTTPSMPRGTPGPRVTGDFRRGGAGRAGPEPESRPARGTATGSRRHGGRSADADDLAGPEGGRRLPLRSGREEGESVAASSLRRSWGPVVAWGGPAPRPGLDPRLQRAPLLFLPNAPRFLWGAPWWTPHRGKGPGGSPRSPPMHPPPGIPGWSPSLSSLQPGEPLYRGYTRPGHSTVVRATDCLAQATQARFEPRDRVLWLP